MDLSQQEKDQQTSSGNSGLANVQPVVVGVIVDEEEGRLEDDDSLESSEDEGLLATIKALEEIKQQCDERRKALTKNTQEQSSAIGNDAGSTLSAKSQSTPLTTSDIRTTISSAINPVTPPNWKIQYEQTITSLTETSKLFPVDETTAEYKVIAALIAPLTPTAVHKIVNPEVWKRYQAERTHMLKKKMGKLEDLLALGMDEMEAKTRVERTKTFPNNPLLTTQEAEENLLNESLLLHCRDRVQNAVDIITDGVDERLTTNEKPDHFGRGIYFVDDPKESDSYTDDRNIIMIFSVLLGDCKDFGNNGHEGLGFKRAPRKKAVESRHLDDQFFDSITARNNRSLPYNEYVIFNRNQCYPLYKVQYKGSRQIRCKSAMALALDPKVPEHYSTARENSPSFSWKGLPTSPNDIFQIFMPTQQQNPIWPFFSTTLYKEMTVREIAAPPTTIVEDTNLDMDHSSTQSLSANRKRKRKET